MKNETVITSLQNPLIHEWRTLNRSRAERMRQGCFLAEGEHMAGEALRAGQAKALLMDADARDKYSALCSVMPDIPLYLLSGHIMQALCDAKTPQGVAALCPYPLPTEQLVPGDLLVALDGVQDPGNVGTILRTMDAAGYNGLLADEKTADVYSPKTLRASMGSVFRIPVCRCDDLPARLKALANDGYEIIAGDLRGEPFYRRPKASKKKCIVIGNEGAGISPAVLDTATMRLKLPMVGGAESLNAAVAGAVMMYDFLRESMD